MNQTKRRMTYRHADGRAESVSCEWDADAEWFVGYLNDGTRAYFDKRGVQVA